MRDAARAEQEVAGARLDRRVADLEGRTALEDPERLVLAVVHVCSGAAAFGGSVISSTLSRPPVSSEVTLISASEPNHHLASPSPWGVATGVSTCVSCVMCPPIGLRPR